MAITANRVQIVCARGCSFFHLQYHAIRAILAKEVAHMFKIGEFSKLTQVSIRMLRYYDEAGLLKPAQTDSFTKYRLYTAEQIPLLNRIRFLRDTGFTVSEIAEALSHWNDASVTAQLERKRLAVEQTIQAEQAKLARIALAKQDIAQETISLHCNVCIKSIPRYQVFSMRRIVPDYYAEGLLWKEMAAYCAQHSIPASTDTFTIYHDPDYRETDIDMEVCAPVAQMGAPDGDFAYRYTEAVPIMASTLVYGPFERIAGAFAALARWLQDHNQYSMAGSSRQMVHRGPWNAQSPDAYLTEIQIPLVHR